MEMAAGSVLSPVPKGEWFSIARRNGDASLHTREGKGRKSAPEVTHKRSPSLQLLPRGSALGRTKGYSPIFSHMLRSPTPATFASSFVTNNTTLSGATFRQPDNSSHCTPPHARVSTNLCITHSVWLQSSLACRAIKHTVDTQEFAMVMQWPREFRCAQGSDPVAHVASSDHGLMLHMGQKHGGQRLLSESIGQLRHLDRGACVLCGATRSRRCNRCSSCNSSAPLQQVRVGDTFQDRRQPGHQDAPHEGTPMDPQVLQSSSGEPSDDSPLPNCPIRNIVLTDRPRRWHSRGVWSLDASRLGQRASKKP